MKYKELADTLPQAVFESDRKGFITYVNRNALSWFGYELKDLKYQHPIIQFLTDDAQKKARSNLKKMLCGEVIGPTEFQMRRKDGTEFTAVVHLLAILLDGKISGIRGLLIDLTERIEAERVVRESEHRLRSITDNMLDIISQIDAECNFLYASPSHLEMLDQHPDELIGKNFLNYIHPEDRQWVRDVFLAAIQKREIPGKVVLRFLHANGRYIWLECSANVMHNVNGDIIGAVIASRDVSERKRAEESLRSSEEKYRSMMNSMSDMVYIVSEARIVEFVNPSMLSKVGRDPSGEKCFKALHGLEIPCKSCPLEASIHGGHAKSEIYSPADGKTYHCSSAPFARPDGNQSALMILTDITYREVAENRIKTALMEKDALLREVHLRVKDNLQFVSSLLNFHRGMVEGRTSADVLQDAQNRLRSMALIHDRLYRSNDLSGIDLSEFVRSLSDQLYRSLSVTREQVAMHIEVNRVQLGIDIAIPCALLLNELIGNALKHGFPNHRNGNIEVTLKQSDLGIELSVADDGVGIPVEELNGPHQKLGFQLVDLMVEQLNAKISISSPSGAKIDILIPKP